MVQHIKHYMYMIIMCEVLIPVVARGIIQSFNNIVEISNVMSIIIITFVLKAFFTYDCITIRIGNWRTQPLSKHHP